MPIVDCVELGDSAIPDPLESLRRRATLHRGRGPFFTSTTSPGSLPTRPAASRTRTPSGRRRSSGPARRIVSRLQVPHMMMRIDDRRRELTRRLQGAEKILCFRPTFSCYFDGAGRVGRCQQICIGGSRSFVTE